jgi:hypothetical protein
LRVPRIQPFEIRFPDLAVPLDPGARLRERLRFDPPRATLGVLPDRDEARAFQDLQMLGDRRLADPKRSRQLRDRRFALHEPREDRAPRGIGEGHERGVEALRGGHSITISFL